MCQGIPCYHGVSVCSVVACTKADVLVTSLRTHRHPRVASQVDTDRRGSAAARNQQTHSWSRMAHWALHVARLAVRIRDRVVGVCACTLHVARCEPSRQSFGRGPYRRATRDAHPCREDSRARRATPAILGHCEHRGSIILGPDLLLDPASPSSLGPSTQWWFGSIS